MGKDRRPTKDTTEKRKRARKSFPYRDRMIDGEQEQRGKGGKRGGK